jgi:type I restriction enzyme S subunit
LTRRMSSLREIAPPAPAVTTPVGEKVWLLNLDQIEPHTGTLLSKEYVERSGLGTSTHAFDDGNVLYSKLRPYLNKVLLPDIAGYCTSELVPMRPNQAVVTREYLAAYLRSPSFLNWVSQQVDGAKMPRVSMKVLWEHRIELPTLDEQKRITSILDKADSLRRKRHEAVRLADEFLRSAYLDLAKKHSDRASVESVLASIPNAARTGPFGSQLLVSEFTETGIPVLGIDNVVSNSFTWGARRFVSPEKYAELERYTVRPGDVIVTIMGTTGRVAVAPEDLPLCISTKHLCTLSLDQKAMRPSYLWACLRWDPEVRAQTQRESKGAIMEGWNMGIVKGLMVSKPPMDAQLKFETLLARISKFSQRASTASNETEALIAALSSKYFGVPISA